MMPAGGLADGPAFILKCSFHCVGQQYPSAVARWASFHDLRGQFVGTDVALSGAGHGSGQGESSDVARDRVERER
jgi:hypothetical protein